ncbi:MAG TPA: glycosyltransferase, partial [Gammaproteobacteria bacterium]|nr:glycosyltransferase [Gammaproteobacteria bacterium]
TKGQSDLIKACAMLKKQEFHIKVVLAGRSDSLLYEEQLKRQARELNVIDDILFVGQLNREQLRDWYGVSAVLAFPTYHHEGLPRILMEAQAMEVPCIVYDVGGTSEGIVHEKTGYLIPKGDLKLFTEKLRELLIDENRRKKMGKEARKFVEQRFSLQALAARHEAFYLRILKKHERI